MIGALRSPFADLVIGAIFTTVTALEMVLGDDRVGSLAANLGAALALGLLLAMRRRRPATTMAGFLVLLSVMGLWLTPPPDLALAIFGLLLFPYAVGSRTRNGIAAPLMGALLGTLILVALEYRDSSAADVVFPMAFATAAFMAGRSVRSRTQLAAELHEAAVLAQEDRDAEEQAAVTAERRRIAREIHDLVAHTMTVMVVQAGGARSVLASDPERATVAAGEIERSGREALAEMRRLLGILHPREGGAALAPQPGMAGLPGLIERARAAGLRVQLRESGERRDLPTGVDLAAYRIVQEALTNVLKHAANAPAEVVVRWSEDWVEVEVSDRDQVSVNGSVHNEGMGLIGMRERVRLYGGDIHIGRRRDGGFEVKARLPLGSAGEARHDDERSEARQ